VLTPHSISNSSLPIHIERVERNHQPKNELRKGEKEEVNISETVIKNGRPPLIRVSFHNKEAAQAFCQLFKVCGFFKEFQTLKKY
jgi:hypothetical protein